MPSKPFVTGAASSSHRLGNAPAYPTQDTCIFVKMKIAEKSYLVTDQTTVLRRGLLCLRLKSVRWKRREKLIGLHFSANGCRCGLVKAGKHRQKAPPVGEPPFPSPPLPRLPLPPPVLSPPPLPPPPPKPPPQQPSIWRLRLWIAWNCA